MVSSDNNPSEIVTGLQEIARSAGVELIIAGQSIDSLSGETSMQERLKNSDTRIFIGRVKSPKNLAKVVGSGINFEYTQDVESEESISGRRQDTFLISPQEIRECPDGAFWIVQGGGFTKFATTPPTGF